MLRRCPDLRRLAMSSTLPVARLNRSRGTKVEPGAKQVHADSRRAHSAIAHTVQRDAAVIEDLKKIAALLRSNWPRCRRKGMCGGPGPKRAGSPYCGRSHRGRGRGGGRPEIVSPSRSHTTLDQRKVCPSPTAIIGRRWLRDARAPAYYGAPMIEASIFIMPACPSLSPAESGAFCVGT
jgi:hypothetical protein